MYFYKSSRGEDVVGSLIETLAKKDRIKVATALNTLSQDHNSCTNGLDIKMFRKSIYELKIGRYRVFYVKKASDIVIIHFLRKDSGKIKQNDVDIVLKRAKEILD